MIRLANKYDTNKIIELLKNFAEQQTSSLAKHPETWSRDHVEFILNNIMAGAGFVLIDEEQTGILVAIKSQYLWNKNIIQLQEVMLCGNNKIVIARLIKEYIKIAKEMLEKNQVHQAVLASYIDLDYERFGLKKLETNWEII